jgi:enoyl-CoA hydratase
VDVQEALQIGLVNEIVQKDKHVERALELAERLAAFPQQTMLADRRAMLEGSRLPWREALEFEYRQGRAVMDVAARGAARFAGGEGRHGAGV